MREHTHYIECLAFSPSTLSSLDTADGKTIKGKAATGVLQLRPK
jgi:hypothetical protein